ncbi:MAG: hypothetical protein AWM53_00150 [Candidatus Dichloromethanomonas elyunquensis]|nr:MAG: hypothetical protein AWM53_00150 [Candidatus Dichloromethanomonas elyunquensis]
MSQLDKTLLFEQLENFQIQRHDFLNNFQVIRGYLQLNMPQKALSYIDETVEGLSLQQEIYTIGEKNIVAVLMGWHFGLRLKGVEMAIDFPLEMKSEEFWRERLGEDNAFLFYGYTKECLDLIPEDEDPGNLWVRIRLFPLPRGFGSEFKLLNQGQICLEKNFEAK